MIFQFIPIEPVLSMQRGKGHSIYYSAAVDVFLTMIDWGMALTAIKSGF